MARKKKIEMDIVNYNAAGIDVGSKSYFVAIWLLFVVNILLNAKNQTDINMFIFLSCI